MEGEVQVGAKLLQHLRHLNWFRRKFLHGNLLHLHQYISVLVLTVLNCRRPISEKPSVGCCSTIIIASRRPPVLRKMTNITFKKEEKDLSRAADQLFISNVKNIKRQFKVTSYWEKLALFGENGSIKEKQVCKPRRYASYKLRPTHQLSWVDTKRGCYCECWGTLFKF